MNLITRLQILVDVPSSDPEDARRRKLLNITLMTVAVLVVLMVLFMLLADVLNLTHDKTGLRQTYAGGVGFFIVLGGIYFVNRKVSGWLASLLFLVILSLMLPFVDEAREVVDGRTLFVFTLPIIMASVLLRPSSSFVFAVISIAEITVISASISKAPNIPAVTGFLVVAFIAWLSARSLENALSELVVINRDLDKRVAERTKALAEALSRVQAEAGKNQAILEGIADGVVVFDNHDQAIVANPAVGPLLDASPESLIGITVDDLLDVELLEEKDRAAALTLLKDPSSSSGTAKLQWDKKTLSISAAPVRTADGEIIGKVAVFHDFTREAEVDRMKSDFVAMVSHELRTPLSSILGYSEMLREGVYGDVSEGQVGAINRIMANTRRLLSIVNDLLDQAQIEAGKLTFHIREFQPNELLEHLTSVMETIVRAKGLKLETVVDSNLPAILEGDPQRLNQVLVNLVNNSVKFTEQGFVRVRLYSPDREHWAIEVCDSGLGITPEAQRFIFEPFRQANMEITRQYGGIGLGLSIVKRLIGLMQGEINLSSQVGQGSVFTITLPLQAVDVHAVQKEKVQDG